jgi:hypothetical protein
MRPLANTALTVMFRQMKVTTKIDGKDAIVTAHGFRSSFRDWAGDKTEFPREVAEAALAHKVGDAAEQAYRRARKKAPAHGRLGGLLRVQDEVHDRQSGSLSVSTPRPSSASRNQGVMKIAAPDLGRHRLAVAA